MTPEQDVFSQLLNTMQSLKSQMSAISEKTMIERAQKQVTVIDDLETGIAYECLKIQEVVESVRAKI